MTGLSTLDAAGRRRSPATVPGYHHDRPPRNTGRLYPADPPTASSMARHAGALGRTSGVRVEFRRLASQAGVRRRFAPHQLRHAHAVELAREGVPLNIIQRQLGHANLGTTSVYLARHRHRGDHRHRPRPTRANDVRNRRSAPLAGRRHQPRERPARSRQA